jgi:mannonate dehydratase
MMKMSMLLPPKYEERKWKLAKQIGVNYAITKAMPELSGRPAPYDFEALRSIKEEFKEAGFELYGLEGDQFDMAPFKEGLPGRDDLIEKYCQMLRNMGRLQIPLLCYNFMAVLGWYRTNSNVPERGGAVSSSFDIEDATELVPEDKRITEEKLWDNLFYFLEAVLPVAEEAGVEMALHPDDPPVSPLRGVGRILTDARAFEKVWQKFPVPSNKITFCQATFKTMGEDIKAVSAKWLQENRVAFIHLRDIEGVRNKFRETFHDNGSTSMAEMLQHYHQHGFTGPLRPDHAPAMFGETQNNFAGGISVGYEITGKILAVGHYKGICEAAGIPLE